MSETGTALSNPTTTALALPPGFTEPASPEEFQALQDKAKADSKRRPGQLPGGGVDFFNLPVPNKDARVGTEVATVVRILPHHTKDLRRPAWVIYFRHAARRWIEETKKAAWTMFNCRESVGSDADHRCAGTDARIRLFQYSNELGEEKRPAKEDLSPIRALAKHLGANKLGLFQVIVVSQPNRHWHEDEQKLKPSVMRTPGGVAGKLLELEAERGMMAHPIKGFPVKIIAKKTGPYEQNIEYSVVAGDRSPITEDWYPVFDELHDLDQIVGDVPATEEEELELLRRAFPESFAQYDSLVEADARTGGPQGRSGSKSEAGFGSAAAPHAPQGDFAASAAAPGPAAQAQPARVDAIDAEVLPTDDDIPF